MDNNCNWWDELPEQMFDEIFNLSDLRSSVRMGAVCKSWLSHFNKSSVRRRSPGLPWMMMKKGFPYADQLSFFTVSDTTSFCIEEVPEISEIDMIRFYGSSTDGWVLAMDFVEMEITLIHIWRRLRLPLPDHKTIRHKLSGAGIGTEYFLRSKTWIRKAAISNDATAVLVLLAYHGLLAFCREGDEDWKCIICDSSKRYLDIAYDCKRGQFYALGSDLRVTALSISYNNKPYLAEIAVADRSIVGYSQNVYLVVDSSSGSLFIVTRSLHRDSFQVYEIGLEVEEVVGDPLESLGDRAILLNWNSAMLVTTSQFPEFEGNCIYYIRTEGSSDTVKDLAYFDMESRRTHTLSMLDAVHILSRQTLWITPPTVAQIPNI